MTGLVSHQQQSRKEIRLSETPGYINYRLARSAKQFRGAI